MRRRLLEAHHFLSRLLIFAGPQNGIKGDIQSINVLSSSSPRPKNLFCIFAFLDFSIDQQLWIPENCLWVWSSASVPINRRYVTVHPTFYPWSWFCHPASSLILPVGDFVFSITLILALLSTVILPSSLNWWSCPSEFSYLWVRLFNILDLLFRTIAVLIICFTLPLLQTVDSILAVLSGCSPVSCRENRCCAILLVALSAVSKPILVDKNYIKSIF